MGFLKANDLPPDSEERILALIRSDRVDTVTVPFLYYLYEVYGAPADGGKMSDLAFHEVTEGEAGKPMSMSDLAWQYPRVRRHVRNVLLLFDALFLLRADTIYQLSHLYDIDRAGTINVFPLRHVGINTGVPGRHAGETFGEKNGTQLYCAAGLKGARIQTARNGSLPVTLFHWLVGGEAFLAKEPGEDTAPREQFGYRSLLDEAALEPLR